MPLRAFATAILLVSCTGCFTIKLRAPSGMTEQDALAIIEELAVELGEGWGENWFRSTKDGKPFWQLPGGSRKVLFDRELREREMRDLYQSQYYWPFHRRFPKYKITKADSEGIYVRVDTPGHYVRFGSEEERGRFQQVLDRMRERP